MDYSSIFTERTKSTPISKSSGNVIDEKIKIVKVGVKSISSIIQSKLVIWGEDSKTLGVGPKKLIGGNMEAGFFGETSAKDLITGNELANLIGIANGVSQFSNEPWLKFAYKGKIQYVAKKPFRHSISWYDIIAVDAVYGDRIVEIGAKKYKIRLLRATGEDKKPNPKSVDGKYNGDMCWNSEWNRLMLPIHVEAPSNWRHKNNVSSPTEDWGVDYTDIDLIVSKNFSGAKNWCQETAERPVYAIYRGDGGVSNCSSTNKLFSSSSYGWRPVLELIN